MGVVDFIKLPMILDKVTFKSFKVMSPTGLHHDVLCGMGPYVKDVCSVSVWFWYKIDNNPAGTF